MLSEEMKMRTPSHPRPISSSCECLECQRFVTLADGESTLLVGINKRGQITLFNRGCEAVTGFSHKEMIGKSFVTQLIPREQRSVFRQFFRPFTPRDVPAHYVSEIVTKTGESPTIAWYNNFRTDDKGTLLEIISVGIDITSHRQAAMTLISREGYFRSLIENVQDVITVIKPDGTTTYTSPSIQRVLGYTPEEVLGSQGFDLIHPEDLALVLGTIQDGIQNPRTSYHVECRFLHKNGSWRTFGVVGQATRTEAGDLDIIFTSRDITEQKRAEKTLQETEARQLALLDAIPDLMFQLNREGTFLAYKAASEEDLYVPPSAFIGKPLEAVLPPFLAKLLKENLEQAFQTGKLQQFEYQLPIGEKLRDWEARLAVSAENEVVVIVREITERKQSEQEIQEARARAEFFNDLMAHDITNIHQGVLSLLELALQDPDLPKTSAELMPKAITQLLRSTTLIAKVKKFAQVEKAPLALVTTDIAQPFSAAVQAVKGSFPHKQLHLKTSIRPGKYHAHADEFLFDLFYNLLHNTMKFDRRQQVKVTAGARHISRYLKIQVKDHGPGIHDSEKHQIFTRLDPQEPHPSTSGRGIGLTLVQRIVTRYGGKIWVEDRVSGDHTQGACFIILLPKEEE